MKAIKVSFLGATNTKPSRLKASDLDGNSVTVPWDTQEPESQNLRYRRAAKALCQKMQWSGTWIGGHLGPSDMVFVCIHNSEIGRMLGMTPEYPAFSL